MHVARTPFEDSHLNDNDFTAGLAEHFGIPLPSQVMATIPVVNYLDLSGDAPVLIAEKCSNCGALYFGRRSACEHCFSTGPFERTELARTGVVKTFTIVQRAAPGLQAPYVSAVVDLDGGGYVKANIVNVPPTPDTIKTGMPVRLTTFSLGTDDEGTEAIAFAFEPA